MSAISITDAKPLLDVVTRRHVPLSSFFAPRTVAVIGATETAGGVGRTLLANVGGGRSHGGVIPVNPPRSSVLGRQASASVSAIPVPVDLAVVATPAATVPEAIRDCADAG